MIGVAALKPDEAYCPFCMKTQSKFEELLLEPECGVTAISLRNIAKLISAHGIVKLIYHSPYPNPDDPYTEITFQDGFRWTATGFACGYGGEGPAGLATACTKFLDRWDITLDVTSRLDKDGNTCYLFTRGQGIGKLIDKVNGVMDCEFNIEIF